MNASTKKVRDWRKRNPDKAADLEKRNAARKRAMKRLAERYPGVFARYFEEEMNA